jgi:penicillin amidase
MGRFFRFLLSGFLLLGIVWQLCISHTIRDKAIPAIGSFFNPFSGFWCNAEGASAWRGQTYTYEIPGMTGAGTVVYDDLLVPHLFATNLEDACRLQGFVTATHRLWQMDIAARKSAGRLSEVLGVRTLKQDQLTRRRGVHLGAENSLLRWKRNPKTYALLEAYAEGVNAYIRQLKPADYPIEFKLLGYRPEPWSVLKTALVVEGMADILASKETDLSATAALSVFGRPAFDSLYPGRPSRQVAIVADTGQWKNIKPILTPNLPVNARFSMGEEASESLLSATLTEGIDGYLRGSNNWAVGGSRTESGRPILCNDPHLNLTLPSIWFQLQVHTPEISTYGVSLPGVPAVVIGYNEHVAWGFTNVGQDITDWLRIDWKNRERTQYGVDGRILEVKLVIERIEVRGGATVMDTVRHTLYGPVVYDQEKDHPLRQFAYHWAATEAPETDILDGFLRLNAAKNYTDYRIGMQGFDSPAQNFVFASQTGDFAIQVQGRFPLRQKEQGRFLLDGAHSVSAWQGFIPQDHVPSVKNPSSGYVCSANQVSTDPTYPYYYLGEFDAFRGRRANALLAGTQKATVGSMQKMQLDNYSQRSADAAPAMLRLLSREKLDAEGLQMANMMDSWDFHYDRHLMAPTLFEVWWDSCYVDVWDEITALRQGGTPIQYPEVWRTIELLQADTLNRFFDDQQTPGRETARELVTRAFLKMQAYFRKNPAQKTHWGKAKGFQLKHLAGIDAFSRMDLEIGGHKTALNAVGKSHGPSWRMVVALDDQVTGYGVYPGGQSGNPGSRFYDNLLDYWVRGEYYELLMLRSPSDRPERIIATLQFKAP